MQLTTEQKLRIAVMGLAKGASLTESKSPYIGHPIYIPRPNEKLNESKEICQFISSLIHETIFLQFNGSYYALDGTSCVALKQKM